MPELPNTLHVVTAATTDTVTAATTDTVTAATTDVPVNSINATSSEILALISAINALTTNMALLDSGIQEAIGLRELITNNLTESRRLLAISAMSIAPHKRRRRRGPSRKKNNARKTRRKVR